MIVKRTNAKLSSTPCLSILILCVYQSIVFRVFYIRLLHTRWSFHSQSDLRRSMDLAPNADLFPVDLIYYC